MLLNLCLNFSLYGLYLFFYFFLSLSSDIHVCTIFIPTIITRALYRRYVPFFLLPSVFHWGHLARSTFPTFILVNPILVSLTLQTFRQFCRDCYSAPQSRQSAKPFLQSSELGLPHPSPAGECALPPLVRGVRGTLACGKGVGESQFRRGDIHCGTLSTYVLCAPHNLYSTTALPFSFSHSLTHLFLLFLHFLITIFFLHLRTPYSFPFQSVSTWTLSFSSAYSSSPHSSLPSEVILYLSLFLF